MSHSIQRQHTVILLLGPILSGLMLSLCLLSLPYPVVGFWAPFELVPLFLSIHGLGLSSRTPMQHARRAFLYIWFFGWVVQLVGFFWITQPIIYFSNVPPFVAYPLYVLISVLTALFFPILFAPFILNAWCQTKYPNKKLSPVALALAMTLLEIITPRFFQWSLGLTMQPYPWVAQFSSLFGFNTLSFFIFLSNLLLTNGILSRTRSTLLKNGALVLLVWSVIICFGIYRTHLFDSTKASLPTTRVAYVQPNFTFNGLASQELPTQDAQPRSLTRLIQMSEETILKSIAFDGRRPDLVVWPESAISDLLLFEPQDVRLISEFSRDHRVPVLLQAAQWKKTGHVFDINSALIWSASFIIDKNGMRKESFQKWVPMPFGEHVLLEDIFPNWGKWYRSIFTNASKLEIGSSYQALPYNTNHAVAPLICFDAISQELPYLQAKKGNADIFVNQANFVWMVLSHAGGEFAALSQSRAIENSRSLISVSNTGPTLAFDPLGRMILPSTELLKQSTGFVDLPISQERTLFSIVYIWPLVISGILSILFLGVQIFRKK